MGFTSTDGHPCVKPLIEAALLYVATHEAFTTPLITFVLPFTAARALSDFCGSFFKRSISLLKCPFIQQSCFHVQTRYRENVQTIFCLQNKDCLLSWINWPLSPARIALPGRRLFFQFYTPIINLQSAGKKCSPLCHHTTPTI